MYGRRPHYEAVTNNGGVSYAVSRGGAEQGHRLSIILSTNPLPGHSDEYKTALIVTKGLIA
jgi:hypothetical protein